MPGVFCEVVLSPVIFGLSVACQVYVMPGMLPVNNRPTELLLQMESLIAFVTEGIGFMRTGIFIAGPLHPARIANAV